MYILLISVILLLLMLMLFLPVRIITGYNDTIYFFIKILFFRITPQKKHSKKSDSASDKTAKKKNTLEILKKILKLQDEIRNFVSYCTNKCIAVENFSLSVDFGTGDAATAGILTGALNAFVYSALAIIHQNTLLKKHSIQINPDFEKEKFNMDFLCIVRTRPVHIISMGIRIIRLYRLFKSK